MSYSRGRKFRGYRRHGHGMKGRRGHGLKGGRGFAGLGKHKWIWLNKYYREHWGRHGFTSHHPSRPEVAINIDQLQENFPVFSDLGYARKENDAWHVDLVAAGYTKLLGKGRVENRIFVKVPKVSALALKKLKEAGGGVEPNA
ncbi:MAG: uL15 family ribosomal protein [Thermoplasmata archaeon]|jgi:large subunit ribosomal protein L15|nr:50S ribosomal protein L15 [Thermoplasmatales archaeon]